MRRIPRRALRRMAVPAPVQQNSGHETFLAPIRGLVLSESLAKSDRRSARVLNNWFPLTESVRARRGTTLYATLSTTGGIGSLFTYQSGGTEKFFGTADGKIFNITTVGDAASVPGSSDVSSQTDDYYSTAQIGTAGGDYLYAVNGADKPQLYDGTTWTAIDGVSSPAITGVTTTGLSFVWKFANRLFFVEGGTQSARYLPVDAIGGAASELSLAGVFPTNSPLLFGGTWSADSGSGMDDRCVFVSEDGDVVVYEGTDPSSASTWVKVGVYKITRPLGKNATMRAGGDLLIATEDGIVPLSQIVQKDPAALSLSAVSFNIGPLWREEAATRTTPWEILKWDSNNMMVVALPVSSAVHDAKCLVANLETGAWCVFTGWDTSTVGLFNLNGYFGTSGGQVFAMEQGGSDNSVNYTCEFVGTFDPLRTPGAAKTTRQARAVYKAATPFDDKITAAVDYNESLPAPPASVADFATDGWDGGKWDEALWDAGATEGSNITSRWRSVAAIGYAIAPQVQITFGTTGSPVVELITLDLTYESGGLVV